MSRAREEENDSGQAARITYQARLTDHGYHGKGTDTARTGWRGRGPVHRLLASIISESFTKSKNFRQLEVAYVALNFTKFHEISKEKCRWFQSTCHTYVGTNNIEKR